MQLKAGIRLRWETPKTEKTAIQLGLSHLYHAMCASYPSCRVSRQFLEKWESMPRLRKK